MGKTQVSEVKQKEELLDRLWEVIPTTKGEASPLLREYTEGKIGLEELVMSIGICLDLLGSYLEDDIPQEIRKAENRLKDLLRDHKHAKDGSACKPF